MKNLHIVGRITKDAELVVRNDIPVTNFNVAVNTRKATAKKNEQGKRIYETRTEFYRVTLWREKAEGLVPYLTKGRLVELMSKDFTLETWMDRQGKVNPVIHLNSPDIELWDSAKKAVEEPTEENSTEAPEVDPEELPFD